MLYNINNETILHLTLIIIGIIVSSNMGQFSNVSVLKLRRMLL